MHLRIGVAILIIPNFDNNASDLLSLNKYIELKKLHLGLLESTRKKIQYC